ncbi:MAG: ROK family protein [Rhizobiales bacterium]|nr:ROK family protein [Hyphomicrobiales bacterium]
MARKSSVLPRKKEQLLSERVPFALHGARILPRVEVTSYNLELTEKNKFVGDRANKKALTKLVQNWRQVLSKNGDDPFAGLSEGDLSRSEMEKFLKKGTPEAAGVIQSAIHDFAERLVEVIGKYARNAGEWKRVKEIVVGGGLSGSQVGRLVIGRAQALLSKGKHKIVLRPVSADPDDAALIGALQLIPGWLFAGFDVAFAVDIGGSNVRIGAVRFKLDKKMEIGTAKVVFRKHWAHAEDDASRQEILDFITKNLKKAVRWAKRKGLKAVPYIGVACPGRIRADGTVDRGAQNLPGHWESENFNLPQYLRDHITVLATQDTVVVMHNDAILQGLSELPSVRSKVWGVLTIGTGLGNGSFEFRSRRTSR